LGDLCVLLEAPLYQPGLLCIYGPKQKTIAFPWHLRILWGLTGLEQAGQWRQESHPRDAPVARICRNLLSYQISLKRCRCRVVPSKILQRLLLGLVWLENLVLVEIEEHHVLIGRWVRKDEAVEAPDREGARAVVHEELPIYFWVIVVCESLNVKLQVLNQIVTLYSIFKHHVSVNLQICLGILVEASDRVIILGQYALRGLLQELSILRVHVLVVLVDIPAILDGLDCPIRALDTDRIGQQLEQLSAL
jgi:hypothetical protein